MPKNVENFEIRTLGRDDYAQAAEIFAFVHALHQANRPDIYRKTNVPLGEDEFFKMCDDPHEIMLCAVRDGKILGLARTVMRGNAGDAVTLSRVRAVMEELAVLPQAQGMGIGTAQRMYVLRGYVPDGSGVWYEGHVLEQYVPCVNDDELVLYLSKKLK